MTALELQARGAQGSQFQSRAVMEVASAWLYAAPHAKFQTATEDSTATRGLRLRYTWANASPLIGSVTNRPMPRQIKPATFNTIRSRKNPNSSMVRPREISQLC